MKTPLDIVLERMKEYDPSYLVELLDISSEDIIARFMDIIYQREDYLQGEMEVFNDTDDPDQDYDDDGLTEVCDDEDY